MTPSFPRPHITKEEARALCEVIAGHVDAILEGRRHTAVVEARQGQAAPHIAIVVTINPEFIPQLLEFCKQNPQACTVRSGDAISEIKTCLEN
jgi:hypothetical protein